MKKIRISRKKDGLLIVDFICYDKKVERFLVDKLKKDKRLNVNECEV